jgi:hypothetical protein
VAIGNAVAKTSERSRQPREERPDLRSAVDDRGVPRDRAERRGTGAAANVLTCR